eukprot:5616620-Pleurochrysis_carterae.AAC.1
MPRESVPWPLGGGHVSGADATPAPAWGVSHPSSSDPRPSSIYDALTPPPLSRGWSWMGEKNRSRLFAL